MCSYEVHFVFLCTGILYLCKWMVWFVSLNVLVFFFFIQVLCFSDSPHHCAHRGPLLLSAHMFCGPRALLQVAPNSRCTRDAGVNICRPITTSGFPQSYFWPQTSPLLDLVQGSQLCPKWPSHLHAHQQGMRGPQRRELWREIMLTNQIRIQTSVSKEWSHGGMLATSLKEANSPSFYILNTS